MPNIVAGRFEQQTDADAAIAELMRQGFARDRVSSFFVNPPGEHAKSVLGGDREASPGAETAGTGAVAGAAIGGAVGIGLGLAATPVVGTVAVPTAGGIGAYMGALAGALGKMEDSPAETRPYAETPPEVRHGGIVVAAFAPEPEQRATALEVLQASGAQDIETAEGHWHDGQWTDFDPVAPPGAEAGGPLAGEARPQRIRK
ncbi:MAG TPA: hypothetical protein VGA51_05305 [Casimicrobiaceae bacterium]